MFVMFVIKYGFVDNYFQVKGQEEVQVFDGIVYFLEYKMFEELIGDIFVIFVFNGVFVNVFMSFDQIVYLFFVIEYVNENI